MIPNAPDVRNPVTAKAMSRVAGTRMGLKITKRGAVTARAISVPVRVRPARRRRTAPMGKMVTKATTWDLVGPFWKISVMLCVSAAGRWWCLSAIASTGELRLPLPADQLNDR